MDPQDRLDGGGAEDSGFRMDSGPGADSGASDAGPMASGCGLSPGRNDRVWTLQHQGRTREFYVHVPSGYVAAQPTPVVLDFHGRMMNAGLEKALTGLVQAADTGGFIAIHPEGHGGTWNAGLCCGQAMTEDVDDVGFVSALLDEVEARLCVDEKRIFATGMSNGGFMVHRLACELSDRIAAIVSVAGVNSLLSCAPSRPVPVLHFHGTEDRIVPYGGFGGFASVTGTIEGWARRNSCSGETVELFHQDDVLCVGRVGCAAGADVELCTIEGGGHTWPGGPSLLGIVEAGTMTVSATEMLWTFFEAHPMP